MPAQDGVVTSRDASATMLSTMLLGGIALIKVRAKPWPAILGRSMEMTKSTQPPRRLDSSDAALLGAFIVVAVLGTWQRCLLVNDGAVYLAAAWLGNAWDLFYDQNTGRAVSSCRVGPAWSLRPLLHQRARCLHGRGTCALFRGAARAVAGAGLVEPQRLFSRLYLAIVLALVFFTSEMVQGIGLWMIWLALFADPGRSRVVTAVATAVLAVALAFTHPGIALLSLLVGICGGALGLLGLPFPRRLAVAALAMGLFLTAAYFALAATFSPTNPTIAAQHAGSRYDYINPMWMLGTLGFFPVLIALWLLLLAPGLEATGLRWRLSQRAILIVGAIGLGFAFGGAHILTWIFARQTAPYTLALALALALASPVAAWSMAARRPLAIYSGIIVVAALSYTVDLALFARAVETQLAPLQANDTSPPRFVEIKRSPPPAVQAFARGYFKWIAGDNYVRDVVLYDYGGQRMTFAFYTFFQSGRRVVLFRPLDQPGEWIPFECAPVDRARAQPYDEVDARMLRFLRERYCVGKS